MKLPKLWASMADMAGAYPKCRPENQHKIAETYGIPIVLGRKEKNGVRLNAVLGYERSSHFWKVVKIAGYTTVKKRDGREVLVYTGYIHDKFQEKE